MSQTTLPEYDFRNAKLEKIPLKLIRENTEALRTQVDKEDEQYKGLVDSVKNHGIMNPISVREIVDPATNETLYGLVDGLHRFNAAMDAGLSEIPAQIVTMDEANLVEAQILGNVHKIETKPVQYTKALLRILGSNPLLTLTELAARLSRSTTWLTERLQLVKLSEPIQKLVDGGELTLTNAYALTKLPVDKQQELLQQALSQSPAAFVPLATNVLKEVQAARREGRKAETATFKPVERMQRLPAIRDQKDLADKNPEQSAIIQSAKKHGITTVEGAIAFALKWVLHADPDSIAADEAQWNADQKAKAEKAQERAAKKKEEADKKAAAVAAAAVGN
jgi:ParB/RepB/Spo0J family partition protein